MSFAEVTLERKGCIQYIRKRKYIEINSLKNRLSVTTFVLKETFSLNIVSGRAKCLIQKMFLGGSRSSWINWAWGVKTLWCTSFITTRLVWDVKSIKLLKLSCELSGYINENSFLVFCYISFDYKLYNSYDVFIKVICHYFFGHWFPHIQ